MFFDIVRIYEDEDIIIIFLLFLMRPSMKLSNTFLFGHSFNSSKVKYTLGFVNLQEEDELFIDYSEMDSMTNFMKIKIYQHIIKKINIKI